MAWLIFQVRNCDQATSIHAGAFTFEKSVSLAQSAARRQRVISHIFYIAKQVRIFHGEIDRVEHLYSDPEPIFSKEQWACMYRNKQNELIFSASEEAAFRTAKIVSRTACKGEEVFYDIMRLARTLELADGEIVAEFNDYIERNPQ